MAREKLDDATIETAISALPGWSREGDLLRRELQFDDFAAAFGFMSRMALVSESMNHHPNWSNVWNKVTIELSTHDADGITELDLEWARRAEGAVGG